MRAARRGLTHRARRAGRTPGSAAPVARPPQAPVKPVVCWDFDETLGYFRPLEFKFLGIEPPFAMPPVRLKPGIRELLQSLSEFTHVVTTAAMELYAREVLHGQGLLDCFVEVIARE